MKTFTLFAAAAILAVAAPACAQTAKADPAAGYYGNTFVIDGPDGRQRFHINKNRSWVGYFPGNHSFSGTWRVQGKRFCFDMKGEDAHPHCFDGMLNRKPGAKWALREHGKPATGSIIAGRR